MRLTYKQLKSYAVETQSGTDLGHIIDLVLDIDGQLIAQYVVKTQMIGGKTLYISRDQVVRWTESTLVVDDTVTPVELSEERQAPPVGSSGAVAMREGE